MNLVTAVAPRLLRNSVIPLIAGASIAAPAILAAQRAPAPNVDVWFEQGNEFDRGEPGRVMYSGDNGSYVTILRVNTDGRVTVLRPSQPNSRSKYAAGQTGVGIPFQADPTQGVGYVFAVASRTPFNFRNYRASGDRWNFGTLGERGGVDPFEIVDRFARSSVGRRGSYSIAYAPYEIGRGGAGRASYRHGVAYDEAYGYYGGYEDPWGASPYRRGYDDYRYYGGNGNRGYANHDYRYGANSRYSQDPRTHSLRHCPDGTLAPYTSPCAAFARPGHRNQSHHDARNGAAHGQGRHDVHQQSRQAVPRPTPQPRVRPRRP